MTITKAKIAAMNLAGIYKESHLFYMPKEEAYEILKDLSGVDFGHDLIAWAKWAKHERKILEALRRSHREERMLEFGVETVDGRIDTTSESYQRFLEHEQEQVRAIIEEFDVDAFEREDAERFGN